MTQVELEAIRRMTHRFRVHAVGAMTVLTMFFIFLLGQMPSARQLTELKAELARYKAFTAEFSHVFPSVPERLP